MREMEYFVKTAFGESDNYVGGKDDPKQGSGQGNGAAPPTWQQISTTMIRAQHSAGHGITVTSPISGKTKKMIGLLYVDDTNLWAGLNKEDDMLNVVNKGQEAVTSWGKLLMATGGDLNPEKCNWTLHNMVAKEDGDWEYEVCKPAANTVKEGKVLPGTELEPRAEGTTNDIDDLQMTVPQTDGSNAHIDQLQSCQAEKFRTLCSSRW